jgi:hypothetical protein
MLQFIAYGEELNLVYPPRPKDPNQPWDPKWSVKVRLKSTGMTTLMADDSDGSGGNGRPSSKKRKQTRSQDNESNDSQKSAEESDSAAGKSQEGIGERVKGLFGF